MKRNLIDGIFNVYFPFELNGGKSLYHINKLCNRIRDRQIKYLRICRRPRTDLMDSISLRSQIEEAITIGQKHMGGYHDCGSEPYASTNIAKAFHYSREDNLFLAEPSVFISHLAMDIK